MYDLKEATFLVPVWVDQPERLRNFYTLVHYLKKHLNTNVLVGEVGQKAYNAGELEKAAVVGYKYVFMQEPSEFFNRMRTINTLAAMTSTPVIVIQDTDVLLSPNHYVEANEMVSLFSYDLVYPYDGNFYNIPEKSVGLIVSSLDLSSLNPSMCCNMRPAGDSVGGILFWNKIKFMECGGGNEHFVSWGYEDTEMFERANKLGVKIGRCEKGLYHLPHKPSLNSLNGTHAYYKSNEQEWLKVKGMSKEQLTEYIKTWR